MLFRQGGREGDTAARDSVTESAAGRHEAAQRRRDVDRRPLFRRALEGDDPAAAAGLARHHHDHHDYDHHRRHYRRYSGTSERWYCRRYRRWPRIGNYRSHTKESFDTALMDPIDRSRHRGFRIVQSRNRLLEMYLRLAQKIDAITYQIKSTQNDTIFYR